MIIKAHCTDSYDEWLTKNGMSEETASGNPKAPSSCVVNLSWLGIVVEGNDSRVFFCLVLELAQQADARIDDANPEILIVEEDDDDGEDDDVEIDI